MQLWPPTTCSYLNVMWGYMVNVYLLVTPIRNFTVMVFIPCYIDKMLWIPIKFFSHSFWKSTYMYFLVVAYRYWPKCILPIEWLCITSRPIINVVCWLFLHKKVPILLNLDTRKQISIVRSDTLDLETMGILNPAGWLVSIDDCIWVWPY